MDFETKTRGETTTDLTTVEARSSSIEAPAPDTEERITSDFTGHKTTVPSTETRGRPANIDGSNQSNIQDKLKDLSSDDTIR